MKKIRFTTHAYDIGQEPVIMGQAFIDEFAALDRKLDNDIEAMIEVGKMLSLY